MRSRYLCVSQFPSQVPVIREQAGHYLDDGKWIFSLLHFLRMKIAPRVLCVIAHLISLFWLRVRRAALLLSPLPHNALWSSWSRGNSSHLSSKSASLLMAYIQSELKQCKQGQSSECSNHHHLTSQSFTVVLDKIPMRCFVGLRATLAVAAHHCNVPVTPSRHLSLVMTRAQPLRLPVSAQPRPESRN